MSGGGGSPPCLVVTLDRLPAWILPASGSTWVAMPAVDALAGRGLLFDRLIATGDDDLATLRDLGFAALGTDSVVVTDAPPVAAAAESAGAEVRLVAAVARATPATDPAATQLARLMAAARDAVAAGRHAVVWVHAASLGVAWDAPAELREAYADPEDPAPYAGVAVPEMRLAADTDPDLVVGVRQAFAGQLTHLDACLGPLFAAATGWHMLVAGVRGIGLGIHGHVGGGPLPPFGELVHVPAILADATGRMAAQRYGGLVVPADLGCTLADLLVEPHGGSRPPAAVDAAVPWRGVSLAPLFEHWLPPIRDRVIVTGPDGAAAVTPSWHGILDGGGAVDVHRADRFSLFAKPDDYFEQANVADRCRAAAEQLAEVSRQSLDGDLKGAWLAVVPSEA
jgi:hypothetical protein